METVPDEGLINPHRIEIVVVLPAPFGPSKPKMLAFGIENEMLFTAG
jgi:hypothetical protein